MRPTVKLLSKLAPVMIGVVLVVGMLVFFQFNRAAVNNELVALYLIPRPERLTELYFNDNAHLPSSTTGNQTIRFAFVIHNLETMDYRYVYKISINGNGTKQVVDSGNVVLNDGQYYVKQEEFKLINSPGSLEVIVELLNKQQTIDFWLGK